MIFFGIKNRHLPFAFVAFVRVIAQKSVKLHVPFLRPRRMISPSSIQNLERRGGGTHNSEQNKVPTYEVSVCAVQGARPYMEDEWFISQKKDFLAVFDGHGGEAVSRYLRQNLYANLQAALPMRNNNTTITAIDYKEALKKGLDKVDREVVKISHWSYQGSTAVAAWIHHDEESKISTLVVANIGDSRAILSRNSTPIALTQDHKPDKPKEKKRIETNGGSVVWCGKVDQDGNPIKYSGLYRVNGNLALARAVGDRSERPAISAEPDFSVVNIDSMAQFILLATDGLWDVMTSKEVVSLIEAKLSQHSTENGAELSELRTKMASFVVAEALRRGTSDNVTVVILWLAPSKK